MFFEIHIFKDNQNKSEIENTNKSKSKKWNLKFYLKIVPLLLSILFIIPSPTAHAIFGDLGAGWAQVPYLVKILDENHKRYQQLKLMMDHSQNSSDYLRTIHYGIENITGLMSSLPLKDQGILGNLRSFNNSIETVYQIYGKIPKSPEEVLHKLHDESIAESLVMIALSKDYSKAQEANSNSLIQQASMASPKGAARATAVSNAMILESINQLIRLQSQSLKLQSEVMAMQNKKDKSDVRSYQKVHGKIGKLFQSVPRSNKFIKF